MNDFPFYISISLTNEAYLGPNPDDCSSRTGMPVAPIARSTFYDLSGVVNVLERQGISLFVSEFGEDFRPVREFLSCKNSVTVPLPKVFSLTDFLPEEQIQADNRVAEVISRLASTIEANEDESKGSND